MLHHLQTQIDRHFSPQTEFLIALSGGVDSVVLLHLFSQLKRKVRTIHIHHGLSPNADAWATFCEQLCKRWKMPFLLQKVSVGIEGGVESAARKARYHAIRECANENEIIVTAHHQDDQAETFLLALKRGSGVKGLGAMQAVSFLQNVTLFRPLLAVSKTEILAYAHANALNWIEDESNFSNDYDRNFLRNEVLPLLNQRWVHFSEAVARSAAHCANQQALVAELLAETLNRLADFAEKTLDISDFASFSTLKQQQLLRLWLEKCGATMPSQAQMTQMIENVILAEVDKNPQLKVGEKILRRYQNRLFLTEKDIEIPAFEMILKPNESVNLPHHLGELIHRGEEIIYQKGEHLAQLCLPLAVQNQPLQIRFGHSGKVKLWEKPHHEEMKKIYQNANVPVWKRKNTFSVFFNDALVGLLV